MTTAVASHRRPLLIALVLAAGALALTLLLLRGPSPTPASASSHSEAPLIGQDPRADNTDLYAFVTPDDPSTPADETDTVTIIANYIPLEAPASGPNFYSFDDSVLYKINVDNTGDGEEDLSYEFRFKTETRRPNTFLYNDGQITSLGDSDWNRPQTYSVTLVRKHGKPKKDVLGTDIPTPPVNVGPRSIGTPPGYAALSASAVTGLSGGGKVFAGQRDDPFYVDLGSVFDLAGLRPFNPFHAIPLPTEAGRDALENYSTHSIAIQVPITQLTGAVPVIGIYASAERQKVRVIKKDGTIDGKDGFVQVSRLGEPLINEAVIGLGQKDYWNRSDPSDDSQFAGRYLTPEVSHLENLLYGSVLMPIDETGRTDLEKILLTGIQVSPSFNLNFTGPKRADLLRLNTSIAPTAPIGAGDRLGVLAGDLAGFPNGRRLEDDIVDIELRAFAQGYGPIVNGLLGAEFPNKTPNNTLGDGVDNNDKSFLDHFPYVADPESGYDVPGP